MLQNQQSATEGPGAIVMTTEVPTADEARRALLTMMRVLKEFRKERPDMPASHIFSFLTVALDEGKGVHEYAAIADIPPTTMTRHLLDLGEVTRKREPGLGLLMQKMDPLDRRKHQTFLTNTGKALLRRVLHEYKHGR